MDDNLKLTVTVDADDWERITRRQRYLEAALVQAYRGSRRLKEWFAASELAAMRLPALPRTRQGVFRKAQYEEWMYRTMEGRGGEQHEFHFSCLPRPAFEEMLARIIGPSPESYTDEHDVGPDIPIPVLPPAPPKAAPGNMAPAWTLPLLRLLRREPAADPERLADRLGELLPPAWECPSPADVTTFLRQIGRIT